MPHSLDSFFHPTSVAVVGASATPGSVGSILIRNLLENPFGGVVYPINPKRKAVHGVLCYASISALPETVDLAVIATPAVTVPSVVRECAERGVKAGIIISAGFSELGEEGKTLEKQIREIAKGKMRLIGPNCLGVIHPPSNLNASFAASMAKPGRVALLSQSGAICTSILDWATRKNIGFSTFVSVGAMADVDFADLIDYFGDDPNTRSLILYMESIGNVRKFLSAARAVARSKTIIIVKSGRSEAAAKAAASHTGALAGSDAVFDAAFRRAGILRVDTIPDLFHMSEILAMQPPPRGPALVIITNAGGPGVMATDALTLAGGELASLSSTTRAGLDAVLPPFWSHANPIDVLGDATPKRYRDVVEICARDPDIHGLFVLLTPQAMSDPAETARQLIPFAKLDKPILASWMGGEAVEEGKRILNNASIPTFDSPEGAVQAFLNMVQYRRNQELLYERPEAMPEQAPDQTTVRQVFEEARLVDRFLLTEAEAKSVLAAYGIPVVQTLTATTVEDAVRAADQLGYPVVVKLLSETITHKTDVGGVQLNLVDASAVRVAFQTIRDALTKLGKGEAFGGVTVQRMIKLRGQELIVGSSMDLQFGPVILFGAGGTLVEVMQDSALSLPPLNRTLARRLIDRTKIAKALRGVRGQKAVDLSVLETLLVRFSQLVSDWPDIAEIDINPLLAGPDGIVALDARVLLEKSRPVEGSPSRLAIRPYPNQFTFPFSLKNGVGVTIRPMRPEDETLLIAHHSLLSENTIRMRYFSLVKTLSRENLIRLCHLDYDRELGLIAVSQSEGTTKMMGVSRYYLDPETGSAEFAVVVGDPWQGQGLGRELMRRLIEVAKVNGVKRLIGAVLPVNDPMRQLAREMGFREQPAPGDDVVHAVLDL